MAQWLLLILCGFSAAYGINGWHTIRIIIMVLDMAVISYITVQGSQ